MPVLLPATQGRSSVPGCVNTRPSGGCHPLGLDGNAGPCSMTWCSTALRSTPHATTRDTSYETLVLTDDGRRRRR